MGDSAWAPHRRTQPPAEKLAAVGRPGVARAAQQQVTFSAVLDPTQLWLHNLRSREGASRHLWKFHKAFVCLLPSPPISQRNRIKFIDPSTYYLFHQLYCGGEEGPAGGEAGGWRPFPGALGGPRSPLTQARIRRGHHRLCCVQGLWMEEATSPARHRGSWRGSAARPPPPPPGLVDIP